MSACQECGLPTATVQEVVDGRARYADTQGGHNDRHTLVVEAATNAAADLTAGRDERGTHDA